MEIKLLNEIKEKASKARKTIILPESHDERVLKAAVKLTKEKTVSVITLGDEDRIHKDAKRLDVDLTGVRIINPTTSDKLSDFTIFSSTYVSTKVLQLIRLEALFSRICFLLR